MLERTRLKSRILIIGGPDVNARIEFIVNSDQSFDFIVLGSNKKLKKQFAFNNIRYIDYYLPSNSNPVKMVYSILNIFFLVKKIKPHLVHTFDTLPGILGRLASIWAKTPTVIGTQTGLGKMYALDGSSKRIIKYFFKKINKYVCSKSHMTVYQNSDDISRMKNLKIVNEENSTLIVSSGINIEKFSKETVEDHDKKKLSEDLGIKQNEIIKTLISRLIKSKGIIEFCQAAKLIRKDVKNIKFLLIGDIKENNSEYIKFSELDPFKDDIIWLGHREDIKKILSISDVFVLPTYYPEGVPRVLLEAASMGLPLIAAKNPGTNEIVIEEYNGFLIMPKNVEILVEKISLLAKEKDLRKKFSENSRKYVCENFDIKNIVSQYNKLYHKYL